MKKRVTEDEVYQSQVYVSLMEMSTQIHTDTYPLTHKHRHTTPKVSKHFVDELIEMEILCCRNTHYFQIDYYKYIYFYMWKFFLLFALNSKANDHNWNQESSYFHTTSRKKKLIYDAGTKY